MILVVGLSHRSAPVEVRERFATGAEILSEVLARLAARKELREVLFLSTCNRVEVWASPAGPARDASDAALVAVRDVLARHGGLASPEELAPYIYEVDGEDAVKHIFRVAASLDSMVLGEPQILGQVKEAYLAAKTAGTLSNMLGRCVHHAFTVAKRVRTETQLGAGTVSISSVAVDLARRIFGELTKRTVLLVGAGEMAEAAAKSLGKGAHAIRVCNRSFDRGAALARDFGGAAAQWEMLEDELAVADIVVASTASPTYVVTREMVKRVMKARKGRTLFFIDIAVPRNVEPTVHSIDNVYVFNVDDLEQEVAEGLKNRQGEAAAAEGIVGAELEQFRAWARGLHVQPTVVALRAKTRAILLAELERSTSGRLKHLTEGDRAALAQMVESAVNKLLHAPTTRLKASAATEEGADMASALKHLFDLPEPPQTEEEEARETGKEATAGEGGERLPN
jgi:glutamyl-tRNA reductase